MRIAIHWFPCEIDVKNTRIKQLTKQTEINIASTINQKVIA